MDKMKICLYIYLYVCIYGTCVFHICILLYLCVMKYFHVIHVERSSYMSKDIAKLATFESQKEVLYIGLMESEERKAKA